MAWLNSGCDPLQLSYLVASWTVGDCEENREGFQLLCGVCAHFLSHFFLAMFESFVLKGMLKSLQSVKKCLLFPSQPLQDFCMNSRNMGKWAPMQAY